MLMFRNTRESWGWPARALHWIVAVLVLGLFMHGLWMEELPDDAAHFQVWLHSTFGISLLVIAAAGFLWWLVNVVPVEPPRTPEWQRRAARGVHWMLYALIFAVAITGWALNGTMRAPVPIALFGFIGVPQLTGPGSGAHELLEEAHEMLANVLIALVAVHVAAALYHHFILRDGVARRMLGRKPTHESS
jgi:cytochrome b561